MTEDIHTPLKGHTVPNKENIQVDRAAMTDDHGADQVDESYAKDAPGSVDPKVSQAYERANKTGAAIKGEGEID